MHKMNLIHYRKMLKISVHKACGNAVNIKGYASGVRNTTSTELFVIFINTTTWTCHNCNLVLTRHGPDVSIYNDFLWNSAAYV